jgi:hypothetical protein
MMALRPPDDVTAATGGVPGGADPVLAAVWPGDGAVAAAGTGDGAAAEAASAGGSADAGVDMGPAWVEGDAIAAPV